MRSRHILLATLAALVALAGSALAQECPECDPDGEPDDSWYSSVDSGIVTDEGSVLEDTDVSVGENEHGRFTWFQYCLKFLDILGNSIVVTYEAFVSEDGADLDGSVSVNGEEVADLDDSPAGGLDDATWGHMEETGLLETLPSHEDLPPGVDVDECLYADELPELDVSAEAVASCEVTV